MREIQLTQGKAALVDDEDFEWLNQSKWRAGLTGKTFYARTHIKKHGGGYRNVLMHRLIMGNPEGKSIDHIDGDGLNNQRHNLRICSVAQNAHNATRMSTNTSGFKGVFWDRRSQTWRAGVMAYGKRKWLGCFNSPVQAALAYDKAAREYHGEFARTNFLVSDQPEALVEPGRRTLCSRNTSGYRGVHWGRQDGKWRAKIKALGKHRTLGIFTCPIEAAHCYDRAARFYFGDRALLNFPLSADLDLFDRPAA